MGGRGTVQSVAEVWSVPGKISGLQKSSDDSSCQKQVADRLPGVGNDKVTSPLPQWAATVREVLLPRLYQVENFLQRETTVFLGNGAGERMLDDSQMTNIGNF